MYLYRIISTEKSVYILKCVSIYGYLCNQDWHLKFSFKF